MRLISVLKDKTSKILKLTMAVPSVSCSHRNRRVFWKLFHAFDLYSGKMEYWQSNRLALAINNDTQYVSVLFEIRYSGGFPTFPLSLSFSISQSLADPVSVRDPIPNLFFFIKKYWFLSSSFFHRLDTNLSFSGAPLLLYWSEYIDGPLFATQNLPQEILVFL